LASAIGLLNKIISNYKYNFCSGDPEKSDNYGNTALHLAAAKESFSLVSCPSLCQPIQISLIAFIKLNNLIKVKIWGKRLFKGRKLVGSF
jgi:hypothetical protein